MAVASIAVGCEETVGAVVAPVAGTIVDGAALGAAAPAAGAQAATKAITTSSVKEIFKRFIILSSLEVLLPGFSCTGQNGTNKILLGLLLLPDPAFLLPGCATPKVSRYLELKVRSFISVISSIA
jgi:hypothetical protein